MGNPEQTKKTPKNGLMYCKCNIHKSEFHCRSKHQIPSLVQADIHGLGGTQYQRATKKKQQKHNCELSRFSTCISNTDRGYATQCKWFSYEYVNQVIIWQHNTQQWLQFTVQ